MEISKKLNLVVQVETDSGNIYVHSTPIRKEIYREHFIPLSKTFTAIFSQGLSVIAGPRVAYLMLETVCKDMNIWEGERGVKNTLVQEIIRSSSVIIPVDGRGWDDQPLDVAISRGVVDLDDVMGELVFFTCVSAINKPSQAIRMMDDVSSLWGSVCTSLNCTEWVASLPTSTIAEISGETATISSVPS
ncbi:hypothetical protein [Budvicia aquatica]|uniref:Uncharacterized protein n=1 Tax=Budvicia aquatica TaxID=82979 RepID=A0A2C6C484_9GAMM|nr:hypothetical protein [Budvicia aquatica]PHI31160.1 hypothetical protein CRN84_18350 [Budvicia aquatica]VFS51414.1 Uncharacterised protein [Budvicia aquatica]